MKTQRLDSSGKISAYFDVFSCIDCCTRKSHRHRSIEALEDLIERWSNHDRSSEKLSRLINQHYVLGNKVEELGELELRKNPKKPGELGYSLGRKIEIESEKAYIAKFRNERELIREIGRIEGKDFCLECLKLQPFRTPTKEDYEKARREFNDPKVLKRKVQIYGKSIIDITVPGDVTVEDVPYLKNFEIFVDTYDVCCGCNYLNRWKKDLASTNLHNSGDGKQLKVEDVVDHVGGMFKDLKEKVLQGNDNGYCDNCGNKLRPTSKFCGSCGTSVP